METDAVKYSGKEAVQLGGAGVAGLECEPDAIVDVPAGLVEGLPKSFKKATKAEIAERDKALAAAAKAAADAEKAAAEAAEKEGE